MLPNKALTAVITKLIRIPFWLQRKRPFVTPKKLLILQPGGLPEILLTTPLLTTLANAFPDTQIDWAIQESAYPLLKGNPHLTNLFSIGETPVEQASLSKRFQIAQQIRNQQYDTCLVPSPSSLLAWLAWQSKIPQRIGLHYQGQGFGYTSVGHPSGTAQHRTEQQTSLIPALNLSPSYTRIRHKTVFFPSDPDRTTITHRLVNSLNWLGDSPLFLVNPGSQSDNNRWPLERFVLLCNHLIKTYQAKLLIVGDETDQPLANELQGLVATAVQNWTGQLTLGQLGALCEVADLYVGNESDFAHVAVAVDCPTLVIYGEKRPLDTAPDNNSASVNLLWQPYENAFSWEKGTSVAQVTTAAHQLIKKVTQIP